MAILTRGLLDGECANRQVVLGLDRQRFFDQNGGHARGLGRLEDLQAHVGRRIHVHKIRLFLLEHLSVIGIARRHAMSFAKLVKIVALPR